MIQSLAALLSCGDGIEQVRGKAMLQSKSGHQPAVNTKWLLAHSSRPHAKHYDRLEKVQSLRRLK